LIALHWLLLLSVVPVFGCALTALACCSRCSCCSCCRYRTYRHGVRLNQSFYHVMASTNGELQITDPHTMLVTRAPFPTAATEADNPMAVARRVQEALQEAADGPRLRRLNEQGVVVVAADAGDQSSSGSSGSGRVSESSERLAVLHFAGPTAVFFDRARGAVQVVGKFVVDREAFARTPGAVAQGLWQQHFGAGAGAAGGRNRNRNSRPPRPVVRVTVGMETSDVVQAVDDAQDFDADGPVCYELAPTVAAGAAEGDVVSRLPTSVITNNNNFVADRRLSPRSAHSPRSPWSPRSPRPTLLLPRVVRSAYRCVWCQSLGEESVSASLDAS
jgi:hypothetical protein